ncbi:MAG: porin [Symbiopectobacterium sp.]
MMKHNVLAVAIPALLAAGTVDAAEVYIKDDNKLDLYGTVSAKHLFSDYEGENGDKSYAHLGFKGETQINNNVTGYGRYEAEFVANTEGDNSGKDVKVRYAFAGLKITDFGTIDYGRNMGIAYDSLAYTDVLPAWGGYQSNADNFLTGRSTAVLTYRNKDFFGLVDGLNFGLQYQGANNSNTLNGANNRKLSRQNGDGWGTSAEYISPVGVGIVANFAAVNRTNEQNATSTGNGKRAEAWGTGLKYDANNIYVAAIYSELRNASYVNSSRTGTPSTDFSDKTKIFEAVAQYNFDFGLTPYLGYFSAKAKDDTNNRNAYITKYVSLGAAYAFNKSFSVYSEYDINLIKDTNSYGINDDDKVAVGITYQF